LDSNLLTSAAQIIDDKVTIVIGDEVEVLVTGTPSYVFAYRVNKSLNEIVVDYDNTQIDLDINQLAEETKIAPSISQVANILKHESIVGSDFVDYDRTMVLTTQEEFDTFVALFNDENLPSRATFFQQLEDREIDFSTNNLLIYRVGGSSTDIGELPPTTPKIRDESITIDLTLDPNRIRISTADFAVFSIAYEVDKSITEMK